MQACPSKKHVKSGNRARPECPVTTHPLSGECSRSDSFHSGLTTAGGGPLCKSTGRHDFVAKKRSCATNTRAYCHRFSSYVGFLNSPHAYKWIMNSCHVTLRSKFESKPYSVADVPLFGLKRLITSENNLSYSCSRQFIQGRRNFRLIG